MSFDGMLKELRIKNFRVFEEEVTLRLRPITVLIGRNSSGKSSLMRFLLMLQQSLDASVEPFLLSEGTRTRLGEFSSLRNSKSRAVNLEFTMEFESRDVLRSRDIKLLEVLKTARPRLDPLTGQRTFSLPAEDPTDEEVTEKVATVLLMGKVNYSRKGQFGKHAVSVTLDDHTIHKDSGDLRTADVKLLRFPPRSNDPQAGLERSLADRLLEPIRYQIRSWQHLEAVRDESTAVIQSAAPTTESVGQRGQSTLSHLKRLLDTGGEAAAFATHHLAQVAEIEDVHFEKNGGGGVVRAFARNPRTGASTYLSNFGFGVSQALPIIVQGAINPSSHLLMVEQPEAQIHPTAQLEMGQFFSELWTQRKVPSLIETHSSNILLRLKLMVSRNELPADAISVAYVHTDKDGRPIVTNLEIDSRGRLEKGLPLEFFGADIGESLKFRAAR